MDKWTHEHTRIHEHKGTGTNGHTDTQNKWTHRESNTQTHRERLDTKRQGYTKGQGYMDTQERDTQREGHTDA